MIAEGKAPAAHHVTHPIDRRKANGASAGDNNTAIASGKGTHPGRIGVIVGDD